MLHWTGFKSHPLPKQDPFPVVIGGAKGKIYERIAKYGQGWFAPTLSADDLATQLKELDAACAREGRDASEIEISCMWVPAMGVDSVAKFRDVGVSRLVIPLQGLGLPNPIEGLDKLADEVISKLG